MKSDIHIWYYGLQISVIAFHLHSIIMSQYAVVVFIVGGGVHHYLHMRKTMYLCETALLFLGTVGTASLITASVFTVDPSEMFFCYCTHKLNISL